MEGTCNSATCKLHDLLGGTVEQCPSFIESWWTPSNKGVPIMVKDCAPKRVFLMIQELSNRLVGVQQAQEQQRNENVWVQVVADVLGKNSGVDLAAFVKERIALQNISQLATIDAKQIINEDN